MRQLHIRPVLFHSLALLLTASLLAVLMTEPPPKVPVETIIEKIDKPKSSNVAIKIMVGLLILVILSEIGYLLYNNYFKPTTTSLSGPTISQEEIKDSKELPSTLETVEETKDNKTPTNINNINHDIVSTFNNFFTHPATTFKNAYISYSIEVEVVAAYHETIDIDGVKTLFHLNLNFENKNITYHFTQKDLITVVLKREDVSCYHDLVTDIKPGDKISFSATTNLINNPNFNSKIIINIL